jgi:hypothetical protein
MVYVKRNKDTAGGSVPDNGTVTVACNISNGITLKLYKFEDEYENVMGLPDAKRLVKKAVLDEDRAVVTLFGPSPEISKDPLRRCIVVRGINNSAYALTPNVDAQWFAEWLRQNAQSPLVKNGCVFAYATEASVKDAAKDRKEFRSGLEPLNVAVDTKGQPLDPRIPRKSGAAVGSVSAIETADVMVG